MSDLGYSKAQLDYDNMLPEPSNIPCCKRCGECEKLYDGYCISCISLEHLSRLDSLSEFASENFDKFKDFIKENHNA